MDARLSASPPSTSDARCESPSKRVERMTSRCKKKDKLDGSRVASLPLGTSCRVRGAVRKKHLAERV